jgi:hypothetical protein
LLDWLLRTYREFRPCDPGVDLSLLARELLPIRSIAENPTPIVRGRRLAGATGTRRCGLPTDPAGNGELNAAKIPDDDVLIANPSFSPFCFGF